MNTPVPAHVSHLLGRAVQVDSDSMPPQIADWLFEHLRFKDEDERRRQELYDKAMEGAITPEENAELDDFVETAYALDLLKARAAVARTGMATAA